MAENSIPLKRVEVAGRQISYRRIGSGERKILFFHGFPGSSNQIALFSGFCSELSLDVLCVDRPGYHESSSLGGDQRDEVLSATLAVLASLGWSSYEVISVSGGTPFALSFVGYHPEGVRHFSIVCGLGPLGIPEFRHAMGVKAVTGLQLLPYVPAAVFTVVLPRPALKNNPAKFRLLQYLLPVSKVDARVVLDPRVSDILLTSLQEAFVQGGVGVKQDARAYLAPARIELGRYSGGIDIWHGDQDHIVPLAVGQQMARAIPQARLHVLKGEGHYSLPFERMGGVLEKR